jgi:hypothetical protein
MEVRSDRSYRFALAPEELWQTLTRTADYQRWWPWLRTFEGSAFGVGERWSCVVQPPLPYAVRFRLTIGEVVDARLVTATVDGDIVGDARLDISPSSEGSELHLVSRLAPSSAILRAVATLARPIAQFGHDWVIDTGLRQFTARALG